MWVYWLFIPLLTAFTVWLSIILLSHLLLRWILPSRQTVIQQTMIQILQEFATSFSFASKIQLLDLEGEIKPLLNQRLDEIVEQLKRQIPLGDFFLSGFFVDRLKSFAKEEILHMIPQVKTRLIEKVEKEFDLKQIIAEQVQNVNMDQLQAYFKERITRAINELALLGALIGLMLGFLESLLFLFFYWKWE